MRPEHFILQHLKNLREGIHLDYSRAPEIVHHKPTIPLRYTPVLPSRGDRKPATKSPFNYRGEQPSLCGEHTMYFESDVERRAAHIFRADRKVVELIEQTPTVYFVDANGDECQHTFDFWLRLANGKRVAIAAKPLSLIVESGLLDTLKRIYRTDISDQVDHITWIDERFANEDANANAEWILLARRVRNEDEYKATRKLVENVTNAVRFWDLVRLAATPAHRRIAIWNLIDEGILRPATPGRVTNSSLLVKVN
jgi:hypothetical protein